MLSWNFKSVLAPLWNLLTCKTSQNCIWGHQQEYVFCYFPQSVRACAQLAVGWAHSYQVMAALSTDVCLRNTVIVPVLHHPLCGVLPHVEDDMSSEATGSFPVLWRKKGQKQDLFLIIIIHWVEMKPLWLMLEAKPGFSSCSQLWAVPWFCFLCGFFFYIMFIASAVSLGSLYYEHSTLLGGNLFWENL